MYGLTLEELREVVRACKPIHIAACTPPYLQEFIAARVAPRAPGLAEKIRGLDKQQMHELCEHIRGQQESAVP
jgi:hypothetical protein